MMENLIDFKTESLEKAVLSLIGDEDPTYKRTALEMIIDLNKQYPVCFFGELVDLNGIIDIAVKTPEKLELIKAIVDTRRLAQDKKLMFPALEKNKARNLSVRDIMRNRRSRSGKALVIENLLRKDKGEPPLQGADKIQYESKVTKQWSKELSAFIKSSRGPEQKKLTQDILNELRQQFWKKIDAQLQKRHEEVRNL